MSAFSYERDTQNGNNTWLTPRWVLEPLGGFDLDPCAHRGWITAREHYYWPEQDGLWLPWHGRVWCNPPYSDEAKPFIERMANHGNGILLVFARTETEAFQRVWHTADAILFVYGRIAFLTHEMQPSDGGAAPSVLAAFGERNIQALHDAKTARAIRGSLVTRWNS